MATEVDTLVLATSKVVARPNPCHAVFFAHRLTIPIPPVTIVPDWHGIIGCIAALGSPSLTPLGLREASWPWRPSLGRVR